MPGFESLWIYIVGPFTGGILAGLSSKLNEYARKAGGMSEDDMDDIANNSVAYNEIGEF